MLVVRCCGRRWSSLPCKRTASTSTEACRPCSRLCSRYTASHQQGSLRLSGTVLSRHTGRLKDGRAFMPRAESFSHKSKCKGLDPLMSSAAKLLLLLLCMDGSRQKAAFMILCMQGESTQQLTLPLLILICQLRDAIEILPDAKDIKFISEQYDTCQQSFLQVCFSALLHNLSGGELHTACLCFIECHDSWLSPIGRLQQ